MFCSLSNIDLAANARSLIRHHNSPLDHRAFRFKSPQLNTSHSKKTNPEAGLFEWCTREDLVTSIRLLANLSTPPRAVALRRTDMPTGMSCLHEWRFNPHYTNQFQNPPQGWAMKLVHERGLEPPRAEAHYPLKVARLPIPPLVQSIASL